ncbi:LLM class flavin-dependent oxidoreductase, partial [Actinoplanes sp. TBRC 11911]|uniref:LLM class flavin-dependent oxidoreductase n=1 Tax=Actinoplanes sp. TBRC 11911 TaxID=2729386 RepID=UPI00145C8367
WEEPYVIYSKILDETDHVIVGPMVTNPGTRDWTVTASLFATLNEMYGNRTICGIGRGDSALRVLGHQPRTLAALRESVQVIRGLANGEKVRLGDTELQFAWAAQSRLEVWVAAYGPKALALTGEVGDGYILQLADPDIAAWMIAAVRKAAAAAGRDPAAIKFCVA